MASLAPKCAAPIVVAAGFLVASGCYHATEIPVDAETYGDARVPHDLGPDAPAALLDATAPVDAATDGGAIDAPDAAAAADDGSVPLVLPCASAIPRYVGDLPCVDAPCGVVSSHVFDHMGCQDPANVLVRPDGEPEIYYEASLIAGGSWHARRAGGVWSTATPVLGFTQSAFVVDSAGCGYAWLTGSPFSGPTTATITGLYAIGDDDFTLLREVDGTSAGEGGLVLDDTGALHALVWGPAGAPSIEVTSASWTSRPAPYDWAQPIAIALGPDASEHRLWADGFHTGLFFYDHAGLPVPVLPTSLPRPGYGAGVHGDIAVSGTTGAGRPRVLVQDYSTSAVYLSVRDDPSAPFHEIAVATPAVPFGIAASDDGDALGVASRGTVDTASGLFVVTYHAGVVGTFDLGVSVHPYSAAMALGQNGHLHIAVCSNDDDVVHYYEVAAAP